MIYPLFDVACAVVDIRSARANAQPVRALYVNIALSTLTGIGLAAVLRVWGHLGRHRGHDASPEARAWSTDGEGPCALRGRI